MISDKDMAVALDGPVPGQSLTQSPENPQSWETAPEYPDLEEFVDELFLNVTKEDNIDGVLDPLRKGIPVEDVAQLVLFQAMASGKISTDLVVLAVEPVIYMLIGLGTVAEIDDMVLYPEDDMMTSEEDEINAMNEELKGSDVSLENLETPKGMSKSLINKLKDGDI